MKKLLLTVIVFLLLISPCFAVGTFKVTGDEIIRGYAGVTHRVLTLAFVADAAAGTIPNLTLNPSGWTDGVFSGTFGTKLTGWVAYKLEIDCNHAGTEPTEDSEIYIYQHSIDLLDGNGVNAIDNTAERQIYFQSDGLPMPQPIIDSLTVTVTQQAAVTNSATGTIYLILKPSN